ncbi:sensor histidine kinase [Cellvibrio zantedeschiae]|uniref:Sensor histidine kinase n=1 Tax=Cellvibrio zantedeschiae TaxID=1237077 RepID=A0ABQ3AUR1_9GAMM|nr:Hpt domain-containing protein [Cellvibrio zantedeschiae]GGY68410.1 sensor histidine kinase [Cellvibrio zantedeschiae]
MNDPQHLDYDALNALKEVMEDDFGFLIETYLKDSSDRLVALHELVKSENADLIRRTAHSFKGSSSNLGAVFLASLCSVVERNALDQKFFTLPEDVSRIEAEFLIVKQKMLDFLG